MVPEVSLSGKTIANKQLMGGGAARLLALGKGCMLVRLELDKGYDQNGHTHPDHESIGYVLSGDIEMRIGSKTYRLGPGSTWYHPAGVEHTSLAVEPSVALEFHSPLRPDLLDLFDLSSIRPIEGDR